MKNTMKVSLVALFAVLFLSSCSNWYNSNDYKKNTSEVKNEVKNEIKTDKIVEKKDMMWEGNMMMDNHEEKKEVIVEVSGNWIYTDYSSEKVANTNWKIVLFFHADWCPTCRATEKDILSKDIPSDLTILKTNFDKESELKKKYWVVAQTTFVQIDNKGNLIKKWVWGRLNDIIEKTK